MDGRDQSDDYIWHFKLRKVDVGASDEDALAEMVRRQVAALLRCVTFTNAGENVAVTGFRFLDDPNREHRLSPLPTEQGSSAPE